MTDSNRALVAADIAPCPFCGARLEKSEFFSNRSRAIYVHPVPEDEDCPCPAYDIRLSNQEPECVAAWNRRASVRAQDVAGLVEGDTRIIVDLSRPRGPTSAEEDLAAERILASVRTSPTREVEGLVLAAADNNHKALVEAWMWPTYKRGDEVLVQPHRGPQQRATVTSVETHYGFGEAPKPYHIYSVALPGQTRHQHLGIEQIVGPLVPFTSTKGTAT
jgi:hypothetical protein